MARSELADPARVPIGLRVSEADAAGIDRVLARPEFAGWSRSEWCREIIRSALRYYAGDPPPVNADPSPVNAEPEPAAAFEHAASPEPIAEPEAQLECPHPADARDYQSGTCAACGAILWD